MKTAVLIHGYDLGAPNWEEVVFGNPDGCIFGRVPMGLAVAAKE